jgi:drug/metabolite transporter (DMT)-like permease
MGLLLFCAYTVQTFGLAGTTPGKNAFLTASYCIIVPFLDWFVEKKRPDRYNISAAVLP